MLVTSAAKVLVPGVSDFAFMLFNQLSCVVKLLFTQTIVYRELDLRFNPELGLTIHMVGAQGSGASPLDAGVRPRPR